MLFMDFVDDQTASLNKFLTTTLKQLIDFEFK